MISKLTRIVLWIGLTFASVALPARLALAAPSAIKFDVNSFLDQPDDLTMIGTCHTASGACTLRAAIMQANRTSGAGATINLPAGSYALTIPASGTDGEANGDLNLTAPPALTNPVINIQGAGASTTIIDANQIDRVLKIDAGRTVIISGVTISGGYSSIENGTGIYNSGSLTVNDSTITGNTTVLSGGGIENDGSLTISNSLISINNAGRGGGIDSMTPLTINNSTIILNNASYGAGIETYAALTVSNSTISRNIAAYFGGGIWDLKSVDMSGSTLYGNSARLGGGIYVTHASLTAWNSTFSQNTASESGGGIDNDSGATNLYNVTIVSNRANTTAVGGSGGGIYNHDAFGATTNIRNTLLAGNTITNASTYRDCAGTISLYGNNIDWGPNDCIFNFPDPAGGGLFQLSALNTLGPLQDNGGPTWTVALLKGSNAIDAGDRRHGCVDYTSIPLATVQRGFARVVGPACDIGAFEYAPLNYVYLPNLFR